MYRCAGQAFYCPENPPPADFFAKFLPGKTPAVTEWAWTSLRLHGQADRPAWYNVGPVRRGRHWVNYEAQPQTGWTMSPSRRPTRNLSPCGGAWSGVCPLGASGGRRKRSRHWAWKARSVLAAARGSQKTKPDPLFCSALILPYPAQQRAGDVRPIVHVLIEREADAAFFRGRAARDRHRAIVPPCSATSRPAGKRRVPCRTTDQTNASAPGSCAVRIRGRSRACTWWKL